MTFFKHRKNNYNHLMFIAFSACCSLRCVNEQNAQIAGLLFLHKTQKLRDFIFPTYDEELEHELIVKHAKYFPDVIYIYCTLRPFNMRLHILILTTVFTQLSLTPKTIGGRVQIRPPTHIHLPFSFCNDY